LGAIHYALPRYFNLYDPCESYKYWKRAVDTYDCSYAHAGLGYLAYMNHNHEASIACFRRSSDLGNARGHYNLGTCYFKGYGSNAMDQVKANQLFLLSAEQGYDAALVSVGSDYLRGGGGLEKNEEKALELYKQAAAQYSESAYYVLGFRYKHGSWSLGQDYDEAFKYLKLAADHDDECDAQLELAEMYRDGLGIPKDVTLALKYYKKAIDSGQVDPGHKGARAYRDLLYSDAL
jgi:TPR repeat protein